MTLIPVDPGNYDHLIALFDMLGERTADQSISHKVMPAFEEHTEFVRSSPYEAWYLFSTRVRDIESGQFVERFIGNAYLTDRREIGIHIRDRDRGFGYGNELLTLVRERHPGPLYANVNPKNHRSNAFFTRHGGRLIQQTYCIE